MKISDFRAIDNGSLRALVNVMMPDGIVLRDCGVMCCDGSRSWASLPPSVSFTSPYDLAQWSDEVIACVRVAHPDFLPPMPRHSAT